MGDNRGDNMENNMENNTKATIRVMEDKNTTTTGPKLSGATMDISNLITSKVPIVAAPKWAAR